MRKYGEKIQPGDRIYCGDGTGVFWPGWHRFSADVIVAPGHRAEEPIRAAVRFVESRPGRPLTTFDCIIEQLVAEGAL